MSSNTTPSSSPHATTNSNDKVLSRRQGGVGFITFNNPLRHNAVSLEMWEATKAILDGYAADEAVRVVVLTGAGGKAFVSGADISKFATERASLDAARTYDAVTAATFDAIDEFPKPTIAMIRGYCVGGGAALAVCCDLRVCTEGSTFAVPAARLGLGYAQAGLRRLVNLVGPAYAKEIFFTARSFEAREALAMGLVNRVVPDVELENEVREIADMICANAPLTIAAAKFAIGDLLRDETARDPARVKALIEACFASADYVEGRTAFIEKRKPSFTGR